MGVNLNSEIQIHTGLLEHGEQFGNAVFSERKPHRNQFGEGLDAHPPKVGYMPIPHSPIVVARQIQGPEPYLQN